MSEQLLVSPRDAAGLLDLSPRTLERWRQTGRGPKFLRFGTRVRYRIQDIEDWISSQGDKS